MFETCSHKIIGLLECSLFFLLISLLLSTVLISLGNNYEKICDDRDEWFVIYRELYLFIIFAIGGYLFSVTKISLVNFFFILALCIWLLLILYITQFSETKKEFNRLAILGLQLLFQFLFLNLTVLKLFILSLSTNKAKQSK
ncbi:MAG: hypothetical protein EOP34_06660 [Rickettsiales bacterium]|nr:MAG: hypothetical protein EOP34_06660 [Rickettsiales bacterium]